MSSKANILFPIETINRELDFRLLLASLCASSSQRVFIGDHDTIYALTDQLKGGLYVGKNIRPTPTKEEAENNQRYELLSKSGFRLVWLDEEGGIFWGQQDEWQWTMLQSIDPAKISAQDRICTWGDLQRNFYRSVAPERTENIQTTGHPRFDLYKPHYREYYDQDVRDLKERWGDFVLINTNFHRAYTVQNLKKIFGTRAQLDPSGFDHGEAVERWHHLIGIFSDFIKLVARLGREYPNLNFIIRPHPSENLKFYQNIFNAVGNVHVLHEGPVGPWLLASRAMIHDGCTTAIEAHFCGTPVINYKPRADERFDCQLPNQFGTRCTTEDEVIEYLQTLLKAPNAISTAGDEQAVDAATALIANFRHDAFPLLATAIQETAALAPGDDRDLPRRLAQREKSRSRFRDLGTRLRSSRVHRSKGDRESGMVDKFYGFNQDDVARKMHAIQKLLNKDIACTVISPQLICIEATTN